MLLEDERYTIEEAIKAYEAELHRADQRYADLQHRLDTTQEGVERLMSEYLALEAQYGRAQQALEVLWRTANVPTQRRALAMLPELGELD